MAIAFVSGHLDLTEEEFKVYYVPLLDLAIEREDEFILGDAKGTDYLTQQYLVNRIEEDRITVCHMFNSPRYLATGIINLIGGFNSDSERDTYMTEHSDYDIAYVTLGREKSGTAKNIDRRNELKC